MRILFVSHCFPPEDRPLAKVGGMQRVGMDLLAALQRRPGVSVEPLLLRAAGAQMALRAVPFYAGALDTIRRRGRSGEIGAVLFSAMPTAWMALPLKPLLRRHPVPMAAICHGHDVIWDFAPYQMLVRRLFSTLDALLPVSRPTGEEALARGMPAERLHVIHNGVELSRFPPPPAPSQRRTALVAAFPEAQALPRDALLLCAVGRQVERKGHAWFIEHVMPLLPGRVHLWLGGDGPQGPAIDAAIARRGLGARVRRMGRASEEQISALYRGADLFVMPNIKVPGDMEGFGVVVLEAGANGMPTLASRLEGIADAVQEGVNGRLVESGDAAAFRDAILAFDRDRDGLSALGRSAEEHVRRTAGWDGIAERYVAVLRDLARTSE